MFRVLEDILELARNLWACTELSQGSFEFYRYNNVTAAILKFWSLRQEQVYSLPFCKT